MFTDHIVSLDESGNVYLHEIGDHRLDVIDPDSPIEKKQKAPVFTGAKRRPSIPNPGAHEMGYRRRAVKGFPGLPLAPERVFRHPVVMNFPKEVATLIVHGSTQAEGERR